MPVASKPTTASTLAWELAKYYKSYLVQTDVLELVYMMGLVEKSQCKEFDYQN
jgi:hypothetical protein